MKYTLIIMALFGSIFGSKSQNSDVLTVLNHKEYKEAIEEKEVQLVDVRTAAEFNEGAINGAINIDYFEQDVFDQKFDKLDKDQPVYLYCRSGNRSQKAAAKLETLGFKKIYDLKGGYMSWPYNN